MRRKDYEYLALGDFVYYIAEDLNKHTHYAKMAKVIKKKDNMVYFNINNEYLAYPYESVYTDLKTTLNKLHEYEIEQQGKV